MSFLTPDTNDQTNAVSTTVTDAGDIRVAMTTEDHYLIGAALLSSSAARKLAKALTEAADAAEEQDKLNRAMSRLSIREARLLEQLAALQAKAAELAAR